MNIAYQKGLEGKGIVLIVLCSIQVFGTQVYDASRYQLIIDREPFGAEPLQGPSPADLAAQQRKMDVAVANAAKQLRLCFLMESESGEIRAGFENLKATAGVARSVILHEGETFQGMKLLKIDLLASKATLEKDGVPVIFELAKPPTAARPTSTRRPTPAPQKRHFGGGFRKRSPPPPEQPKLSKAEEKRLYEERKAQLQQYQMEVIRAGMPPLPIPLTKEMDDELVAEGVLPPVEE